jgi:hypothetical protein
MKEEYLIDAGFDVIWTEEDFPLVDKEVEEGTGDQDERASRCVDGERQRSNVAKEEGGIWWWRRTFWILGLRVVPIKRLFSQIYVEVDDVDEGVRSDSGGQTETVEWR